MAIFFAVAVGCGRHPSQTKITSEPHKRDYTGESLPDPRFTPGDTLDVSKSDICAPGYTKTIRDVPAAVKKRIYLMYGRSRESGVCCELDHLIPLELGGSNRPTNLWPQRFDLEWNARAKDRIEAGDREQLDRRLSEIRRDRRPPPHSVGSEDGDEPKACACDRRPDHRTGAARWRSPDFDFFGRIHN